MILDEPLTAMIPPPDLWGSTGYTANNNKVGLKMVMVMFLLNHYIQQEDEEQEEGWSKVCSARSQEVRRGKFEIRHGVREVER